MVPQRFRQALTEAACVLGSVLYGPVRRRRRSELARRPDLRSILVLNEVSGVGNLVLLTGLLANARRLYPHARLTVAMPFSRNVRSILGDLADEIVWLPASESLPVRLLFALRTLRRHRSDLALATFFSARGQTSILLALSGSRFRVAYAQSQRLGFLNTITLEDTGGHEIDRHLRLLEFARRPLERQTSVLPSDESVRAARRLLAESGLGTTRPLLGIHPGSDRVNAAKRWPIECFVSVIDDIARRGLGDVLVLLGPDELELRASLGAVARDGVRVVAAEDLPRVMALIACCDAFLSNDSGLMHVAGALSVPVVAIFGPTSVEKNAPLGRATVLTAPGVACRPCYVGPPLTCTQDRRYCLERIEVAEVTGVVGDLLSTSVRVKQAAVNP